MRTMFATGIVVAGLAMSVLPAHGQQKIGYLDSQAVVQQVPGATEAQAAIQQEAQRLQSRLVAIQDSLDALVADFNKQSVLLSPDEKKRREDQLRSRKQGWDQRAEILQQEAQNRRQELMKPIMDRVQAVIEAVRKEGGYAIILDAASGALVSADTTLDLTTRVIERLKAGAAGSGTPPGRR